MPRQHVALQRGMRGQVLRHAAPRAPSWVPCWLNSSRSLFIEPLLWDLKVYYVMFNVSWKVRSL
jgi:hypothetical protein